MNRADDPVHLPGGSSAADTDAALVLAAGKGTRMRSSLPKVLHPLAGKPLLVRVLNVLDEAGFSRPTVVVGYDEARVRQVVGERCHYVSQREQLGTGHAAQVGLDALPPSTRRVLVIHGDEPMIGPEVFCDMLDLQQRTDAAVVLLTTHVDNTRGFGRVVRDARNEPVALSQESELSPEQRAIREVNLGVYVFEAEFLREVLPRLEPHPPKGELYLTDVIAMAAGRVTAITLPGGEDLMGINDLVHLEQATQTIYRRTNRRLMESGVTILDSASTFIDEDVEIDADTVIYPFTLISGPCGIGGSCQIGPNARIVASRIGERCRLEASTVEESVVSDDVTIGPYAHLRPGSRVGPHCEIGNYAEIKESTLGAGSRMHHFSYLGDAQVGADVNVGAGAITCNFDGNAKYQTVIEDGVFIGSDTLLRAPITIGKGSYTGAGAVVTHDVPPGKVAVGMPARIIRSRE
jgi:bifunctional UDP-N-acetylglucosamine pyrophosphorylase / glucosamine-1-phosphate N-acetyltransferase